MNDGRKEKLEAIRRELEKQEDEMQRLYAMAAKLGDVEIGLSIRFGGSAGRCALAAG
jgi:hypothetical protein